MFGRSPRSLHASDETAYSIGHKTLQKPEIGAAIAKNEIRLAKKLDVTVERIVEELATIGFAPLNHDSVKVADKRAAPNEPERHRCSLVLSQSVGGDAARRDG
jgi:hypothetical protein